MSTPTPTSTYTPVVLSTFPFNPLTTTFLPSPSCSGIYSSVVGMVDDQKSCLPPGFSTGATDYFSPGVACPSGYYSACHDTSGVASITTVTCCPTRGDIRLSCVDPATLAGVWETLFCSWIAPESGQVLSMTLSESGTTSTIATTMTSPEGLNAYGVRMVHQATDLCSSSSTSTGAGATTTTGSSQSQTGTATPDSSSSGLSTGAKVAIGVVIPVVVLGALAGLFLWWRRRRQHYSGVAEMGGEPVMPSKEPYGGGSSGGPSPGVYGNYYDPHKNIHTAAPSELSSWGSPTGGDAAVPANSHPHQIAELSDNTPPTELPAETRR